MSRSLGPLSAYFSLLLLNSAYFCLLRTSHCTATPTFAWHSGWKDDPGGISSQGEVRFPNPLDIHGSWGTWLHKVGPSIDGEGGVPYCIEMNDIGKSIALHWIILHLIGFAGRRHLIAALPLICSDPTLLVSHPDPEMSQKLNKGFFDAKSLFQGSQIMN